MKNDRILLVDDEANVLAALRRHLVRQKLDITTAQSGAEGLQILRDGGPFAVVISDYRMPQMDGVEFLAHASRVSPDTVRIMLTGTTEMEVTLEAVNRGNIFRFLLKPVAPEQLSQAINAALEQHALIVSQRQLLQEMTIIQLIDRELNTTLNLRRAMRITLNWAMNHSEAAGGLIGRLGEGGLCITDIQGMDEETDGRSPLPLERFPVLQQAVESGEFRQAQIEPGQGLLPAACFQTAVPILRDKNVRGALLLEHTSALDEDTVRFLARLCDHASIAITNAELYDEVQAANIAKSEFVSFVSHELKNPITSIGGFAELLLSMAGGPLNPAQKDMISTIKAGVRRMTSLVSDLTDISRIEAGQMKLSFSTFPLPEALNEVVTAQTPSLESKKQTIRLSLPPELPPVVADRNRLVQVVTNLVSNAHKYTPEGGHILIGVEASPDYWSQDGAARLLHLWVQDDGIGISPEEQKKVFQKFFRSSDAAATSSPGTGLGLSITRNLVELQGGKIWFESEFRKGTTFHITIPAAG